MSTLTEPTLSFGRVVEMIGKVRERLDRSTAALDAAGIPYAVVGGNAVATWIATRDRGAIRTTQDVDLLLRRGDLAAAKAALETAGFAHYHLMGVDTFIDGPDGVPSQGVHILYAGEKVRPEYTVTSPDVEESTLTHEAFRVVRLEPLVRMKLASWRRKDQVHLQDMVRVGLVDATWPDRYPPELAVRLREIIADPDG